MPNKPKEKYPPGMTLRHTLEGHEDAIFGLAWSPDGRILASGSTDKTIRLWDGDSGELRQTLKGHSYFVYSVSWSPDGRTLASGSGDKTIRLWDGKSGELRQTLKRQSDWIWSVSWCPDDRTLASGSGDKTIRLWDGKSGELRQTFKGHSSIVLSVSWSPDGRMFASGSSDKTIRLWDGKSGELRQTLKGHSFQVWSVSWSPDGRTLASGSEDKTIRLWDAQTGRLLNVLEGHTSTVQAVSFSSDGRLLASKSADNTVILWCCDTWETVAVLDEPASGAWPPELAFHPSLPVLATLGEKDTVIRIWDLDYKTLLGVEPATPSVHYKNAKVVLVGDSGVGKSGLGLVLTGKKFEPTESTHGRHVWTFDNQEVELDDGKRKETRETLLWDLAGQSGYRLFHKLHLGEVAVALVLFDSRSETDPFAGVGYWARALDEATKGFPLKKFLVASRIDRGGPQVSDARIDEVLKRYGFAGFIETSAKRGDGVKELAKTIKENITWDQLPSISAPELFAQTKDFLVSEKEEGRVLSTPEELLLNFKNNNGKSKDISEEIFNTCLGRIEAAGLAMQLSFSKQVLLQPEMIDNYCAWMAHEARREPDGLGFIPEQQAKNGDFPMDEEHRIKNKKDEEMMLITSVKEVVGRGIAIRQPTEKGEMLVFPSELRKDLPNYPGEYNLAVAFSFKGPVSAIYATLAVCLINSLAFKKEKLFKNAVLFRGTRKQVCGFAVEYPDKSNDTLGRLVVFFDNDTEIDIKHLFLRYVNQQLEKLALEGSVERERVYQCSCGYNIPPDLVVLRKERKKTTVICGGCERHLPIDDLAEESTIPDDRVDIIEADGIEEKERQKRLTVLDERERGEQFHVFLCHNSRDKPDVRRLDKKLREQGVLPWIDEKGILAGDQFVPVLQEIIDTVPTAIIIIGPHSLGRWQKQEYYAFLQRFVEHRQEKGMKRLRLIPILLPGAPTISEELPTFLRSFNYVDLRKGLDDRDQMRKLVQAILSEGRDI